MSNNRADFVKVNGYGAIAANGESANTFYVVCFTYIPLTLQEDVESDGNQLTSGDPIYIYVAPYLKKRCDCVNEHSCYSKYTR